MRDCSGEGVCERDARDELDASADGVCVRDVDEQCDADAQGDPVADGVGAALDVTAANADAETRLTGEGIPDTETASDVQPEGEGDCARERASIAEGEWEPDVDKEAQRDGRTDVERTADAVPDDVLLTVALGLVLPTVDSDAPSPDTEARALSVLPPLRDTDALVQRDTDAQLLALADALVPRDDDTQLLVLAEREPVAQTEDDAVARVDRELDSVPVARRVGAVEALPVGDVAAVPLTHVERLATPVVDAEPAVDMDTPPLAVNDAEPRGDGLAMALRDALPQNDERALELELLDAATVAVNEGVSREVRDTHAVAVIERLALTLNDLRCEDVCEGVKPPLGVAASDALLPSDAVTVIDTVVVVL